MNKSDSLGVAPTYGWSFIQLTGKDVVKFLNNFCTAELKRLLPGQAQELMLLNAKGHVLSWGVAFAAEQSLYLMLSGQTADEVIKHLDAYLFSEDVRLATWPVRAWWVGPTRVASIAAEGTPTAERGAAHVGQHVAGQWPIDTAAAGAWSVWQAPHQAWWLITRDSIDWPKVVSDSAPWRTAIAGDKVWIRESIADYHRWRVDAAIPIVGQDTTANTLPQELMRDELAISFTKGCYLGQETVARLDAMGHVNWNLRTLTLDSPWPNNLTDSDSGAPTEEVTIRSAEQTIGQLTSICGEKALARIRASAVEEFRRTQGVNWQLSLNDTPVPQKIHEIL
jgi:tRNA-modifying protein YgfZ